MSEFAITGKGYCYYVNLFYFCNDHHNSKMNNSRNKAGVPHVQGYAANDPKSHSHLCERHHEYYRP